MEDRNRISKKQIDIAIIILLVLVFFVSLSFIQESPSLFQKVPLIAGCCLFVYHAIRRPVIYKAIYLSQIIGALHPFLFVFNIISILLIIVSMFMKNDTGITHVYLLIHAALLNIFALTFLWILLLWMASA